MKKVTIFEHSTFVEKDIQEMCNLNAGYKYSCGLSIAKKSTLLKDTAFTFHFSL